MDGDGPPDPPMSEDGTTGDSVARSASTGATAAVVPTVSIPAGLHGVITLYDGNQEEWIEYAERVEIHFIANELEDVVKRWAIHPKGVRASTYRLINTLAFSGTPKDLTFEEIVERVWNHFNPKSSPIIKWYELTRGSKKRERQ